MALSQAEPSKQLTMDEPVDSVLDQTVSKLVGKSINRVDGSLKVSGQAPYTSEIHRHNQAYGVLVGATIAKGFVDKIDSESIDGIPNIIKVITDPSRFLRNAQQGGVDKAPMQGATEIFYHGQPIAVVIAETFEAATEGAKALKVIYKDETSQAALDFTKELANAHAVDEENGSDKNQTKGDPEQGLANSAVTLKRDYHTPSQNSSAMEPHATLAYWENDKLIMYTANQMLASCKKQVADALDLDLEQVQLIAHYVGGGFGSKLGIAPESIAAAIAAKELNRPVMITMTRPQVMETTVRRSNTRQRIEIGCDKNGIINTMIHKSISSNLPDETFFEPVALSTQFMYRGENRQVNYQMVNLNMVLSGSMRAPGEAVGQIALECAMDELACMLNIDPVELRRRNEPSIDPSENIPFSSRQLLACIEKAAEKFAWDQRVNTPASKLEGDWWKGMGMAAASRGNQLQASEARATLQVDSAKTLGVKAVIETDMTDIGTGSYTVFSQVAADMLGLPIDHIEMRLGDTNLPPAAGSGGSWGAASAGSSIYLACQQLRAMIAEKVGLQADAIDFNDGQIKQADKTSANNSAKPINEDGVPLAEQTNDKRKTKKSYRIADVIAQFDAQKLSAKGQIKPGENGDKYRQASYGANFAEVAVHRVTGEIRVLRMTGAFAAGRILNHKTATSQCYGGMVFGIGSALMEQVIYDKRDGRLCNHDLAEYHVPVNADVPQLEVILLQESDPYTNPIHAKGIGETAISGAAAAIANAVYNAVGIRVYDFPITLDKLLDQLPE